MLDCYKNCANQKLLHVPLVFDPKTKHYQIGLTGHFHHLSNQSDVSLPFLKMV